MQLTPRGVWWPLELVWLVWLSFFSFLLKGFLSPCGSSEETEGVHRQVYASEPTPSESAHSGIEGWVQSSQSVFSLQSKSGQFLSLYKQSVLRNSRFARLSCYWRHRWLHVRFISNEYSININHMMWLIMGINPPTMLAPDTAEICIWLHFSWSAFATMTM